MNWKQSWKALRLLRRNNPARVQCPTRVSNCQPESLPPSRACRRPVLSRYRRSRVVRQQRPSRSSSTPSEPCEKRRARYCEDEDLDSQMLPPTVAVPPPQSLERGDHSESVNVDVAGSGAFLRESTGCCAITQQRGSCGSFNGGQLLSRALGEVEAPCEPHGPHGSARVRFGGSVERHPVDDLLRDAELGC